MLVRKFKTWRDDKGWQYHWFSDSRLHKCQSAVVVHVVSLCQAYKHVSGHEGEKP